MPKGKPAGALCAHLRPDYSCSIYPDRPPVCRNYQPSLEYCGNSRDEAMKNLEYLEKMTG
jgi:uncharacterized protein